MAPRTLRNLRKRLGLTQAAAAALVQVTPNTWARWERGKSRPRGLHQRRLITRLPRLLHASKPHRGQVRPHLRVPAVPEKMPHSTAASLQRFVGTWVGDDVDDLLKEVYALRSEAAF